MAKSCYNLTGVTRHFRFSTEQKLSVNSVVFAHSSYSFYSNTKVYKHIGNRVMVNVETCTHLCHLTIELAFVFCGDVVECSLSNQGGPRFDPGLRHVGFYELILHLVASM